MPRKLKKLQYGFDQLSSVADTQKGGTSEASDTEGTVCRAMMATDAPTDSKFYSDAQACLTR